ncbi:MAG TPA: methyltransferase domain-containing protein [Cellulomonas sp.]
MSTTGRAEVYLHGHHESVLRSHRWRTAANSAAYLLPHLRPGMSLLDVGCGPGTLSVDLAKAVAPGQVVGLDAAGGVLDEARAHAVEHGVDNVRFEVGDAYTLPFPASSFDVVHAHQLLQHLVDPVAALGEMRRVARPGGLVAVRDSDYGAMAWYPQSPGLEEWRALYREVAAALGAQADAGRRLSSWVRAAGFQESGIAAGAGTWCYTTPEDRAWWSGLWAERCVSSDFARQAIAHGLADEVALEQLAEAWREWGQQPDGWFVVLHGEVLARV